MLPALFCLPFYWCQKNNNLAVAKIKDRERNTIFLECLNRGKIIRNLIGEQSAAFYTIWNNERVDNMIKEGLENEARNNYHLKHLNALNTVGYRELFSFFAGEISREKAIELIKRNSRRYARKQLTWFRRDDEMNWFEPNQAKEIISFIENKISEKWDSPVIFWYVCTELS